MGETSDKGDLTVLAKDIEEVFEKHGLEKPGMIIAFTLPDEDYQVCHWVSNLERHDSIKILDATQLKMRSETN